jgi:hypothetical protein
MNPFQNAASGNKFIEQNAKRGSGKVNQQFAPGQVEAAPQPSQQIHPNQNFDNGNSSVDLFVPLTIVPPPNTAITPMIKVTGVGMF